MNKNKKRLPKQDNETALQRNVRNWLNSQGSGYESGWRGAYRDLMHGGCQAGTVGHLIYYTDTVRFYRKHQREIDGLLKEEMESMGGGPAELFGEKWDATDPLGREDGNQNLLAWFGFEQTARRMAEQRDE